MTRQAPSYADDRPMEGTSRFFFLSDHGDATHQTKKKMGKLSDMAPFGSDGWGDTMTRYLDEAGDWTEPGSTGLTYLDETPGWSRDIRAQVQGPPDPMEVYRETRPEDWSVMPTPQANQAYLLMLVERGTSQTLAFVVECSGSYTVDLGYSTGGTFTRVSGRSVSSGQIYEQVVSADNFPNNPTTLGGEVVQVMVRVSGSNITKWANSYAPSARYARSSESAEWSVVEFRGNLPSLTRFTLFAGTRDPSGENVNSCHMLYPLTYLSLEGTNNVKDWSKSLGTPCLTCVTNLDTSKGTNFDNMFNGCSVLRAVPELDTSNGTSFYRMFGSCGNLTYLPRIDTSRGTNLDSMFFACYSLKAAPEGFDTSAATNLKNTFSYCHDLRSVPEDLDTSHVTDFTQTFYECRNLRSIPDIDTSSGTKFLGMFYRCYSIRHFPDLDTSSGTDFSDMFSECCGVAKAPSVKVTSKATDLTGMFEYCNNLCDISGLSAWDVSNVTDIMDLFNSCERMKDLSPLRSWKTGKISHFQSAFSDLSSVTDFSPLESWDVRSAKYFDGCFYGATAKLPSWATPEEDWK